jgi:uncharacterized protein with PIN domain
MRFIADAMLGTLAKWLRILGYDTQFDTSLDDHQLVRLARADGRVLLTRDRELAQRPGIQVVFVVSEQLEAQVAQVLADLDLVPNRSFSRCPVCNELLVELDSETARTRVPLYVAENHRTFRACPACQRVYWRGTHWQHMAEQLDRILENTGSHSQ